MTEYNWADIMNRGELSDKHRESLARDRGFSIETINTCRFFSGGSYLGFPDGHMLSQDKVVIPYIVEGEVISVRPHKLGLPGIPPRIYTPANNPDGGSVIITEGEFKAVACAQLGFRAIAIPGISSFSRKHYDTLRQYLVTNEITQVVIIFDQEVKDDPSLPGFKQDPFKRWDTPFYAYIMAYQLSKHQVRTRVGQLPPAWMREGKVDLDGALGAGQLTTEKLQTILGNAQDPADYLRGLSGEAKHIVTLKVERWFFHSPVFVDFNRYCTMKTIGKGENATQVKVELSNFVISVVATYVSGTEMTREVQFTNVLGQKSPALMISSDIQSSNEKFSAFCHSVGNFVWQGNRDQLGFIWREIYLSQYGNIINMSQFCGYDPKHHHWIFDRMYRQGKFLEMDDNEIFWAKTGHKLMKYDGLTVPEVSCSEFDMTEFMVKLSDSIGRDKAHLCVGWVTACIFMEEIFAEERCFPFLFLVGKRGSGKSTVAEWLMNFWGMFDSGYMADDTTSVAIQRLLSYYSSIPVFIDEYRNVPKVTHKNGVFRSAYNRHSAGKGTRDNMFEIKAQAIRGTILFAGEDSPTDSALASRCLEVYISRSSRSDDHYQWMRANAVNFSGWVHSILLKRDHYADLYMKRYRLIKSALKNELDDDRTAINYAVPMAAVEAVLGVEDIRMGADVLKSAAMARDEVDDISALNQFYDFLEVFFKQAKQSYVWKRVGEAKVIVWFAGLHSEYQKYCRTVGVESFSNRAILKYMKDEPGYLIDEHQKLVMIDGKQYRTVAFAEAFCPDIFLDSIHEEPFI